MRTDDRKQKKKKKKKKKIAGTILSAGLWDILSIDMKGLLPADIRIEFIIAFVDCFTSCTVLVPAKDHSATTVHITLLR